MWLESFVWTSVVSTPVTKHSIEVTLCQDKNTLLEKPTGWHIRIIWTQSLCCTQTRGQFSYTHRTVEHVQPVYTHCLCHVCCQDRHLPVVLSNFKATNVMDLNPLLVVNTRSHVNNVSKSYSCFQWCLKMPKASALKQASAMYRFLCSRESKCMLAELLQETKGV